MYIYMYIIESNYLYKDSYKKNNKKKEKNGKEGGIPFACSINSGFHLRLYLLRELLLSVSYYECQVEYFLWSEFV